MVCDFILWCVISGHSVCCCSVAHHKHLPQLLAGAGNFAKAFGKGVGRPAFRVIQTHFAAGNNVGDVAAKEEVWEVAGQLTGLACSVAVLRALQPMDSAEAVLAVWLVVHSVHVVLRWQACGGGLSQATNIYHSH